MEKRKFKSEQDAGGRGGGDVDVLEGERSQGSRKGGGGGCCQVENCGADLRNAKQYHRRHWVCEIRQWFCWQCSSPVFHDISEFDESKRLPGATRGHNERLQLYVMRHPTIFYPSNYC